MASHRFKPGNPGRPKGSKSKFKLSTVKEALQAKEIDLALKIAEWMLQIPHPAARCTVALQLLAWLEPKTTKIENIGARPNEESMTFKDKQVDDLLAALQSTLKTKDVIATANG